MDAIQSPNTSIYCDRGVNALNPSIPGYVWGSLYNSGQIKNLDAEKLKELGIVHTLSAMKNGNMYIQLTDDIDSIPTDTIIKIAEQLRPCMKFSRGIFQNGNGIPQSFRYALYDEDISINESRRISIVLPG